MRQGRQPLRFEDPYGSVLNSLLAFRTLTDAERTLTRLEQLRQFFAGSDDKKGEEYCRQVGIAGRQRSEGISRNSKTGSRLRAQKREIGEWFRIWLETPELFSSWLELRKRTDEYRAIEAAEHREGDGNLAGQPDSREP